MVEKFSIYGENIGCRLSEIFIVKVLFYTRVHYKCETFRAMHTNHVKTTWWATRYLDRNSDSFRIESFVIWKTRSLFHRVNFIWLCNNINYVLRVQKCTISKKKIRKFIIFIIYRSSKINFNDVSSCISRENNRNFITFSLFSPIKRRDNRSIMFVI